MDFNLANISSLMQGAEGLSLIGLGASQASAGGDLAADSYRMAGQAALEGGRYSAGVYRKAAQLSIVTANYNKELDQRETARQETALAREIGATASSNRAIQGRSGFSFGSGSYLAVQNSVLADKETQILYMRNAATQRRQQITFEGQLSEMEYENKARSAIYQGQVEQVNYNNQAANAKYQGEVASANAMSSGITSGLKMVGSLLS